MKYFFQYRIEKHNIYKYRLFNFSKIIINFILFNIKFILANNFFESVGFINNKNNQKNCFYKINYKNNN